MNGTRRRFGMLTVEALMVLFGVLGAFLLEGWRNDRAVSREVQQDLRSIAAELQRNRNAVEVEIAALHRVSDGGDALIGELDASAEGTTITVSDTLLFLAAVWNPTYDAPLGAVEALLASGRLGEVRDPDLRLGLAGFDELVADAKEEEEFARAVTVDHLQPELDERLAWPSYQHIISGFFGDSGAGESPQALAATAPVPSAGSIELVVSRRLRNLIARRVLWHRAAAGEFRRLQVRLDDLIALVEVELS